MHTVIETAAFIRDAETAGMTEAERAALVDRLAASPTAGDVVSGTGGCRKLRVRGRGKGKSGGYRTIIFFAGAEIPVFLLAVFSKGERADLSQSERNALAKLSATLVDTYGGNIPKPRAP